MAGKIPDSPVLVRAARSDDAATIVAFNARLALESERKILDERVLLTGVRTALAEPDRLRYWVAEVDGAIVGQAAINREWSDWRNGWLWWLQSVYVAEGHRGIGVFRAIHHQIRQEALADPHVIGLRLYVENENVRAQATYLALGFRSGGYHVYEDLWPDRFTSAEPR
jgi:GNAT superfamily N-acetyltransferase